MNETLLKTTEELLTKIEPYVKQIHDLPFDDAVKFYDTLKDAGKIVNNNIAVFEPETRVKICAYQDEILERIIDFSPPIEASWVRGVYTPAVDRYRRWNNVELMKDKGLTGYMLAKEIGARPVMYFAADAKDYPYASLLPELEVLYTNAPDGDHMVYFEYLADNYTQMDTMIFHGMYSLNYLNTYRIARPGGKVYCGLDMNSGWMEAIEWDNPMIRRYGGQCDVTATSCRFLRDALNRNRNVGFLCHFMPSGFYNPTNVRVNADHNLKRNVMLTVGRIGTTQKNNKEMLIAFAKASDVLKGWQLRLVGSIDPEFKPFIDEYFALLPDLKSRVIFTGPITDKTELYKEYARAKIFILTSLMEGGPNVIAEALYHGCMFITSNIDGADDITDYGRFGLTYPVGNTKALVDAMLSLCAKTDKNAFKTHIPKVRAYAERYFDWKRNAKKLAYMLYK